MSIRMQLTCVHLFPSALDCGGDMGSPLHMCLGFTVGVQYNLEVSSPCDGNETKRLCFR